MAFVCDTRNFVIGVYKLGRYPSAVYNETASETMRLPYLSSHRDATHGLFLALTLSGVLASRHVPLTMIAQKTKRQAILIHTFSFS